MADELIMEGTDSSVATAVGTKSVDTKAKPTLDFDAPEFKEAIERAVAERNAGLEKNRDRLKEELKAAKDRAKALEDSFAGVDPELYRNLLSAAEKAEQERAERERKALEEKGEYTRILQQKDELHGKQLADFEAKVAAIAEEKAAMERRLHTSVAMAQLQQELVAHDVKEPALLQGAMALLRDKVTLDTDGDLYVVKFDGSPLSDAIKAWTASDAGKHYVTAPIATGGGTAQTTESSTSVKLPTHRSKMTMAQRLKFIEVNGQEAYNKLPL